MISNPRPGWRYFRNREDSAYDYWAWDPAVEQGYWICKETGQLFGSTLAPSNWTAEEEERTWNDPELELDEGI